MAGIVLSNKINLFVSNSKSQVNGASHYIITAITFVVSPKMSEHFRAIVFLAEKPN